MKSIKIGDTWRLSDKHNEDWRANHTVNPFVGYLVTCIRYDRTYYEHEQQILNGKAWAGQWPRGTLPNALNEPRPIIICTDPEFWTGKIQDHRVRLYRDENNHIVLTQKGSLYTFDPNTDVLCDKMWLDAIKQSAIPIMPLKQSGGIFHEPIEKSEISLSVNILREVIDKIEIEIGRDYLHKIRACAVNVVKKE